MVHLESSEPIRLANALGQQRDDWRARAEAAEGLLRELSAGTTMECYGTCVYCKSKFPPYALENHTRNCPIARARALLEAHHG